MDANCEQKWHRGENDGRMNCQIWAIPAFNLPPVHTITIHVDDVNDSSPEFSSTLFDASVSENLALGGSVLQVVVSDPDVIGTLTMSLSGPGASKFRIVQNGTIYLSQSLDYETARVHDLNVTAFDGVQRSTAFVRIYVIDENDNTPVFLQSFYSFDILENSFVDSTVGRVSATDADSGNNGLVVYQVVSQWGLDYFQLDSLRGIFTLIKPVDFEDRQLYTLKVVARDQGSQPRSAEITVYMNVKDVNDNQPTFDPMSYYREISEDAPVLTPVVNVSATDVDSDKRISPGETLLYVRPDRFYVLTPVVVLLSTHCVSSTPIPTSVLYVPVLCKTSVLYVPVLCKTSVLYVPVLSKTSVLYVPVLCKTSVLYVPVLCKTSVLYVPVLYKTIVLYVPGLCKTSVLYVPVLCRTSVLYVPVLCKTSVLYVPVLYKTSVLYCC
ncbi:hypothetical protein Btru_071060 [Bulinus truncatus]|nr:hypothetical protein Btru_071060 [Bulinus truncatus]